MQRRTCFSIVSLSLMALSLSAWGQAPGQRQGELQVGDAAPDFALQDVTGEKTVKLSELKGLPVVLIFGSCT